MGNTCYILFVASCVMTQDNPSADLFMGNSWDQLGGISTPLLESPKSLFFLVYPNDVYGGFQKWRYTPKESNRWFTMGNRIFSWMITRGTPILGNLHVSQSVDTRKTHSSVVRYDCTPPFAEPPTEKSTFCARAPVTCWVLYVTAMNGVKSLIVFGWFLSFTPLKKHDRH